MKTEKEYLLEKIDHANERLKQLKLQGESSVNKTLKNIRKRRNRFIKELVKILAPEISYADLITEKQIIQ